MVSCCSFLSICKKKSSTVWIVSSSFKQHINITVLSISYNKRKSSDFPGAITNLSYTRNDTNFPTAFLSLLNPSYAKERYSIPRSAIGHNSFSFIIFLSISYRFYCLTWMLVISATSTNCLVRE